MSATKAHGICTFRSGMWWIHKSILKKGNEKETSNPACFADLWNRTQRLIILAPLSTCSAVAWCHMFYLMCKKTFSVAEIVRTWKAKGNLPLLCDHVYDNVWKHLMWLLLLITGVMDKPSLYLLIQLTISAGLFTQEMQNS